MAGRFGRAGGGFAPMFRGEAHGGGRVGGLLPRAGLVRAHRRTRRERWFWDGGRGGVRPARSTGRLATPAPDAQQPAAGKNR